MQTHIFKCAYTAADDDTLNLLYVVKRPVARISVALFF